MTNILVIIGRILRKHFKCIYRKKKSFFSFLLYFWNLHKVFNILKKNKPYTLSIFDILNSKKSGYLIV